MLRLYRVTDCPFNKCVCPELIGQIFLNYTTHAVCEVLTLREWLIEEEIQE